MGIKRTSERARAKFQSLKSWRRALKIKLRIWILSGVFKLRKDIVKYVTVRIISLKKKE